MKKYGLSVEFLVHGYVEVEAKSEKQAREIVEEMPTEEIFESSTIHVTSLEDMEITSVQKVED